MVSRRHRIAPVGCLAGARARVYRMRLITGPAIALAILVCSPVTSAQSAKPAGAWRPVANPLAGWHALGPVLLSVTAVAGFGTGDLNTPEPRSTFVLAALEPGIHAGRASLILAHWLRWEGGGI